MSRGYFQMYTDVDIEVTMEDILDNLNSFDKDEIEQLYEDCKSLLDHAGKRTDDSTFSIEPSNLYDEQKMEYIGIIFNKMTLDELKELADRLK